MSQNLLFVKHGEEDGSKLPLGVRVNARGRKIDLVMMSRLPPPTIELVKAEGDKFDRESQLVEEALGQLSARFPRNTETSHVLLKVLVLNKLYATQINDIDVERVARHIAGLGIDSRLDAGSPDAVDLIANVKIGDKVRNNFSFGTKYCRWHNPAAYAIYDSNVDACLWCYKKQDSFTTFARQDLRYLGYPVFLRIVTAFRDVYGLKSFTFKQLDKFLWEKGPQAKELLKKRSERANAGS